MTFGASGELFSILTLSRIWNCTILSEVSQNFVKIVGKRKVETRPNKLIRWHWDISLKRHFAFARVQLILNGIQALVVFYYHKRNLFGHVRSNQLTSDLIFLDPETWSVMFAEGSRKGVEKFHSNRPTPGTTVTVVNVMHNLPVRWAHYTHVIIVWMAGWTLILCTILLWRAFLWKTVLLTDLSLNRFISNLFKIYPSTCGEL